MDARIGRRQGGESRVASPDDDCRSGRRRLHPALRLRPLAQAPRSVSGRCGTSASMAGFMSVLAYFPDQDVIIAALANRRRATLDALVKKIARALMGLPAPVLRDLPIPPAERARAVGNYDDGMFKFRVYQQEEELFVDVPPLGPPLRLRYQGGHEFATPEPDARYFRFEPPDGPVERRRLGMERTSRVRASHPVDEVCATNRSDRE